jgi:amidohydrolase
MPGETDLDVGGVLGKSFESSGGGAGMSRALEQLKQAVAAEIDRRADHLWEVSLRIHGNPELAFKEFEATALLQSELAESGFRVEKGVGGLETAFKAMKSGKGATPSVALQAEFDALPNLGHACGHNIIACAALGAGIALASLESNLPGTIVVMGTPAEEDGAGKVPMIAAGAWRDIDASLYVHALNFWGVMNENMSSGHVRVHFTGTPANPWAGKPVEGSEHRGASALNGMIAFINNFNTIRTHLHRDVKTRMVITEGGHIGEYVVLDAEVHVYLRGPDHRLIEEAMARLEKCARGAALATETELVWKPDHVYKEKVPNAVLRSAIKANMLGLGLPEVHEEQRDDSATDSGNVSHEVPLGAAFVQIVDGPTTPHSEAFAHAAGSSRGRAGMVAGAKILAWTALDIMARPKLRDEIQREFMTRRSRA